MNVIVGNNEYQVTENLHESMDLDSLQAAGQIIRSLNDSTWKRWHVGLRFTTPPLFGRSLNPKVFGVDSNSLCGCMGSFLAGESSVSKERVVLSGLSCKA